MRLSVIMIAASTFSGSSSSRSSIVSAPSGIGSSSEVSSTLAPMIQTTKPSPIRSFSALVVSVMTSSYGAVAARP